MIAFTGTVTSAISCRMNIYLLIILAALLTQYLLDLIADRMNIKNIQPDLPEEFSGWYDADKYRKSQNYLRESTSFGNLQGTFHLALVLIFILAGGFNIIDSLARGFQHGAITTGLIFAGIIIMGNSLLSLPFSVYDTFIIEEKYGFNRTTPKTFAFDYLKSILLTIIIGGAVFAAIIWFFEKTGSNAWLYCWLAITAFQIVMIFLAPYVIMPLFNKFIPLEEGELRSAIENYAAAQNFKMKGVFKMDGSKRSSKSNAFFTGIGKSRRIVLFDTLIEKHSIAELVAVLAHEMGHYKKKHIISAIVRSFLISGAMFYLLSLFINNPGLFEAFKMEQTSIYASLFFFGFLYSPISMVISMIERAISRKHEYEADKYAAETTGKPDAMISALKKLSVDNLSNLTPHPLKVFLDYSHPPVLQRIMALATPPSALCRPDRSQFHRE